MERENTEILPHDHRGHAGDAAQKSKAYYEAHKQRFIERAKKNNKRYKGERKAQSLLWKAIDRGKIVRQPCEVCGCEKADAHHQDYNKPLEVIWLCRKHHKEWHNNNEPKRAEDVWLADLKEKGIYDTEAIVK